MPPLCKYDSCPPPFSSELLCGFDVDQPDVHSAAAQAPQGKCVYLFAEQFLPAALSHSPLCLCPFISSPGGS